MHTQVIRLAIKMISAVFLMNATTIDFDNYNRVNPRLSLVEPAFKVNNF